MMFLKPKEENFSKSRLDQLLSNSALRKVTVRWRLKINHWIQQEQ